MAWTDGEIEAMAAAYFIGRGARCVRCEGHLYVKEQRDPGRFTADVVLDCHRCGEEVLWVNPESGPGRWEAAEIKDILAAYDLDGAARCQADGALLTIQHTIARDVSELVAHCHRCGRFFRTERGEDRAAGTAADVLRS